MKARSAAARGGLVSAACVACCAPPVIAAFGVTAGVAATLGIFVGLAAATAAVLLGATWIATSTRRGRGVAAAGELVSVPMPTRRTDHRAPGSVPVIHGDRAPT